MSQQRWQCMDYKTWVIASLTHEIDGPFCIIETTDGYRLLWIACWQNVWMTFNIGPLKFRDLTATIEQSWWNWTVILYHIIGDTL